MQRVNDLAIWVNGNEKPYYSGRTRFLKLVEDKLTPKKRQAQTIANAIDRHHKKTIKGNEYWYAWEGDRWVSKGPAKNGDPRKELEASRNKLLKEIEKHEELMRSCVVREVGDHLVFNVKLFKKHVGGQLPSDAIQVSALLNGSSK